MQVKKLRKSVQYLAIYFCAVVLPLSGVYAIFEALLASIPSFATSTAAELIRIGYRVVALLIVVEVVRRYYNETLTLARSRVILARGILALNLRRTSIAYRDVRDIRVEQSVFGRFFNYGSILLGTASTYHHEIRFSGVWDPYTILHEIETRCAKSRGRHSLDEAIARGAPLEHQAAAPAGRRTVSYTRPSQSDHTSASSQPPVQ